MRSVMVYIESPADHIRQKIREVIQDEGGESTRR